ncbi:AAA domain-containing protein [Caulobacter sp. 17J65-9]|nr:AAA domain-containing protein [Caulobacter sp. 17J65-9]
MVLGLICREHVLLIGPPGTGKSAVVQAIAASVEAHSFEYLIGRFTEPSELFGGLDLNALKDGKIQPVTAGMLPEADIAFLDEIFLGSTAILNTLLKILNERTYRRGQFSMTAPLISCVAASNALPEDQALAAFADRFLLTTFVDPVGEDQLPDLLRAGWREARGGEPAGALSMAMIAELQAAALRVDLEPVYETYAHVVRKARLAGATLSDRKVVKAQKLIAAAALLRGASAAGPEDLWPISYLVQSRDHQQHLKELLQAELKQSCNPVLTESVARATYGPTAHAAHLAEQAATLLESRPALATDPLYEIWLVRLETLLTRIDAAFDSKTLPQHLRAVRASVETLLEGHSTGKAVQEPAAPASDPAVLETA